MNNCCRLLKLKFPFEKMCQGGVAANFINVRIDTCSYALISDRSPLCLPLNMHALNIQPTHEAQIKQQADRHLPLTAILYLYK